MYKSLLKPALLLSALFSWGSAQAVVVFEDNFDANNFGSIWSVTSSGVDVGAYTLCNNGTAGLCVDTEGTGAGTNASFNLANDIAGSFTGMFTFSFDYGNNAGFGPYGDNILDWVVTADGNVVANGSVNSGSAEQLSYANFSSSFSPLTTLSNLNIGFSQVGAEGDWGGTVIDNVKLSLVPASVPAPAGLMLLGLGLVGLSAVRRKRAY